MREINVTQKIMVHGQLFILLIIPVFLNSCMHTGVLQTARTTDKGEVQVVVATGYPDITQLLVRYGIADRVDMGVKFNLAGMLVDVKYKFYDDDKTKMAASFAPGIGYSAAAWYDLDYFFGGPDVTNLYQFHLPVYLSYHPAKSFALYLSPRYVLGVTENSDNLYDNSKNHLYHIYGGTAGIKLGDKFGVMMEVNFGGVEPYSDYGYYEYNEFGEDTYYKRGIKRPFRIQGIHLGIHIKTSSK